MVETLESVYAAWDAYVAAARQKAEEASFVAFAGDYLQQMSQKTHLPLNLEQADLLARLADSFVEETGRRHRVLADDQRGEATAVKDLAEAYKQPLFTAEEIEREVKSGAAEYAGLTEEEIRDNLEGRKRLFKRLKGLFAAQQGKDFETVIAPYLSEAERAEAKRLFGGEESADQEVSPATDLEEHMSAHADLVNTQSVLARGLQAKSYGNMLVVEPSEPSEPSDAPQCLVEALGGKLFSRAEDVVRKLTAIEFLLMRMELEDDHVVALPFLAVGAARAAYDWVTKSKSAYQLSMLAAILDDLDPQDEKAQADKEDAK